MNFLNKIDYWLYYKFLTKRRIRDTLVTLKKYYPEYFICCDLTLDRHFDFCYFDKKNLIVYEVLERETRLKIYVVESKFTTLKYVLKEKPGMASAPKDVVLETSRLMIPVYDEFGERLKGWWDKKIPESIYNLVIQFKTKETNDNIERLGMANSFDPDKPKNNNDENNSLIL